jgi:hypothetical protein
LLTLLEPVVRPDSTAAAAETTANDKKDGEDDDKGEDYAFREQQFLFARCLNLFKSPDTDEQFKVLEPPNSR